MKKSFRYVMPVGVEVEYESGSRKTVLKNLVGIKRKQEIEQAEFKALISIENKYLRVVDSSTQITAAFICQMHKDWLGQLYSWAGTYRTVELAKSGFQWPPAYLIEKNMREFECTLLKECTPCLPAPPQDVALAMAKVHAELLLIHPFREGNGRLARWLADIMALQAGYPVPNYGFTGKGAQKSQKAYLCGVQQGYIRNYQPLADFFEDSLKGD